MNICPLMALDPPVTLPRGISISASSVALARYCQLCSLSHTLLVDLYPYLTSSGRLSMSAKSCPASSSSTEVLGSSESLVARIAPADPAPMTM